ncbi:MAG: VWA domain-containing protein, partial [Planctomycetota bacterium]|nr:VWA domain-containing protein [Planctomycetota bacterium]
MALQLSILLIALSLPALLLRRGGGRLARACALIAMSAVLVATLDLPEHLFFEVPARLTVVTTVSPDAAVTRALQTAVGEAVELEFASGVHHPGDRLAGARLRHRQEPDLALVFNGRFASRPGSGTRPPGDGEMVQVLTTRPVLPLDPGSVRVRSMHGISKGRPAMFEVLLGAPGVDRPELRGRLRVLDPGGRVVCDAALPGDAVERVEWRPVVEGRHRVQIVLQVGEGPGRCEMRGVGEVEVAAPPPITIVGAAASSLADALRVQGLPVQVQKSLPTQLVGTLVLLDPLDVAQQRRLREFVEAGGGVFLVGGPRGGALPPPTEPLGALAPVTRLALPPPDKPDEKSEGEASKQRSSETDEDPPPVKKDQEPPEKDTAAKGDTAGRRLKIEERDVHRRAIAMVLLIDRSGSMTNPVEKRDAAGQMNRMDLAKASAMHTAAALDDGDQLAVISFGSSATAVLKLSPVQDRARIRRGLAGLRARRDESTKVGSALDVARRMLVQAKAAVKHVVIVTDGAIHDAGPRYFGALGLARKFHEQKTGITVTLVQAVPDSEMEQGSATRSIKLMEEANGVKFDPDPDVPFPFYIKASSFDAVPRLIVTEVEKVRTKAGRPADKDQPSDSESKPLDKPKPKPETRPVPEQIPTPPPPDPLAGTLEVRAIEEQSPLLAPIPAAGFPRIAGILKVEAHGEALTLLVAGPEGTPLLAFANRGLGKIGVWTSDFLGRWGQAFCDAE